MSNMDVPAINIFADVTISGGAQTPVTPNVSPASNCSSYVAFPGVNTTFRGTWTNVSLNGEWGDVFSLPSSVGTDRTVHNIAVLGSPQLQIRGMWQVTVEAQVGDYRIDVCFGAGCNDTTTTVVTTSRPTATTTTTATTTATTTSTLTSTTTTSTATTPTTTSTVTLPTVAPGSVAIVVQGPTVPVACPSLIECSIVVNNPGVPLASVFGQFSVSGGLLTPTGSNDVQGPCLT
jgi:hypothetical protein